MTNEEMLISYLTRDLENTREERDVWMARFEAKADEYRKGEEARYAIIDELNKVREEHRLCWKEKAELETAKDTAFRNIQYGHEREANLRAELEEAQNLATRFKAQYEEMHSEWNRAVTLANSYRDTAEINEQRCAELVHEVEMLKTQIADDEKNAKALQRNREEVFHRQNALLEWAMDIDVQSKVIRKQLVDMIVNRDYSESRTPVFNSNYSEHEGYYECDCCNREATFVGSSDNYGDDLVFCCDDHR